MNTIQQTTHEEVLKCLQLICAVITSTMGPGGRGIGVSAPFQVIYDETRDLAKEVLYRDNMYTQDGVTGSRLLKHINQNGPLWQWVAKTVTEAANKTMQRIGDGTTTATLLVGALFEFVAEQSKDKNIHFHNLVKNMQQSAKKLREILKPVTLQVKGEDGKFNMDYLRGIATVSANNDAELGAVIAEAVASVGLTGSIRVSDSSTGKEYFERESGYTYPCGVFSDTQLEGQQELTLHNCMGLIINSKIENIETLQAVTNAWAEYCSLNDKLGNVSFPDGSKRARLNVPLVIFISEIEGSALTTIKFNQQNTKTHPCYVVRMPLAGDAREVFLKDLQVVTGCMNVFSDMRGLSIQRFGANCQGETFAVKGERGQSVEQSLNCHWKEFGHMKKVILSRDKVIITPMDENAAQMVVAADNLDNILQLSKVVNDKELLLERITRLRCGLVNFFVHGNTPIELGDRRERIDDAVKACMAAIRGGVVPGGGRAMVWLSQQVFGTFFETTTDFGNVKKEAAIAANCLELALKAPSVKILKNCYVPGEEIDEIIRKYSSVQTPFYEGYNPMSEQWENFVETGILDPADMLVETIENAISVAGKLLNMEFFVNIQNADK